MKKIYYLLGFVLLLFLLILIRLGTVKTDKVGLDRLHDIVPKRVKSQIFLLRSKLFEGKKIFVKSFDVDGVEHKFFKYYLNEENKEVSKNKPTGFLQQFEKQIIFVTGRGNFYLFDIKDLNKKKISLKKINNNFLKLINYDKNFLAKGPLGIRDVKINNNKIFVSYQKKISENCYNLAIAESDLKLNITELKFSDFFSYDECSLKKNERAWAVLSGGRIVFKDNHIFYTIGEMAIKNISQERNSYFGKIIKIDLNDPKSPEIIAKGLRNSQGLFYDLDKDLILITDHAEVGGDEINIFKKSNEITNFGWPLASYGKPYGYKKINYLKSHKDNGFKEPAFYFKEERIGISQIIGYKMNNDKLRYLLTTMRAKSIYFLNFLDNEKIEINKKIYLGERIRDIIKINDENMYIMTMETSPAIGLIKF